MTVDFTYIKNELGPLVIVHRPTWIPPRTNTHTVISHKLNKLSRFCVSDDQLSHTTSMTINTTQQSAISILRLLVDRITLLACTAATILSRFLFRFPVPTHYPHLTSLHALNLPHIELHHSSSHCLISQISFAFSLRTFLYSPGTIVALGCLSCGNYSDSAWMGAVSTDAQPDVCHIK